MTNPKVLRAHDYIDNDYPATEGFDLLTTAQVAALLRCSKAHVSHLAAGRVGGCSPLPAIRLGRRMLVRRTTLTEWLAANENAMIPASPEQAAGRHR
jgi:excisionase family DNA binding protein